MNNSAHSIPEYFQRTAMVYGPEAMEKLSRAKIIIFGVGGVGSWCAEGLVRCGIGSLTMVDADVINATNVNRQLQANSQNIGNAKASELAGRLQAINPQAEIIPQQKFYDQSSAASFDLGGYDCVIDAIDSIANKLMLLENCLSLHTPVVSSMGAAGKRNPSLIRTSTIGETRHCPLARIVRRELKRRQLALDIPCVFSDELPAQAKITFDEKPDPGIVHPKKVNGALVQITAIFGFILCNLAIETILANKIKP